MARTLKDKKRHLRSINGSKEDFNRAYRRHKEGQSRTTEIYHCIERKGYPGILNEDLVWSDEDLQSFYEYKVNRDVDAA